MLVLRLKEHGWVEVTHRSGDVMRIRVHEVIVSRGRPKVELFFDDAPRNFEIERDERLARKVEAEACENA